MSVLSEDVFEGTPKMKKGVLVVVEIVEGTHHHHLHHIGFRLPTPASHSLHSHIPRTNCLRTNKVSYLVPSRRMLQEDTNRR